jgi:hypothetical protein
MNLHTVFTAHDNTKSTLHAEQRLAICLSPILVEKCHLLTASDSGLRNKYIKGRLHEQEMQRFVGATCMAFGHGSVLHAQIDRDMMVFSTMGNWRSGEFRHLFICLCLNFYVKIQSPTGLQRLRTFDQIDC